MNPIKKYFENLSKERLIKAFEVIEIKNETGVYPEDNKVLEIKKELINAINQTLGKEEKMNLDDYSNQTLEKNILYQLAKRYVENN